MIISADFSPRERQFASAGFGSTVRIWDAATFQTLKVLKGRKDDVINVSYSPDGRYLVTAGLTSAGLIDDLFLGGSENVVVWDTRTWEPRYKLRHHHDLGGADFTPDGKTMIFLDGDTMHLWDLESGKSLGKRDRDDVELDGATFSPDGKHAITLDHVKRILRFWRRKD